jgi:hypothetical protein
MSRYSIATNSEGEAMLLLTFLACLDPEINVTVDIKRQKGFGDTGDTASDSINEVMLSDDVETPEALNCDSDQGAQDQLSLGACLPKEEALEQEN